MIVLLRNGNRVHIPDAVSVDVDPIWISFKSSEEKNLAIFRSSDEIIGWWTEGRAEICNA